MSARLYTIMALVLLLAAIVAGGFSASNVVAAKSEKNGKRPLTFDVSENMAPLPKGRFAFQQEPVHADGLPAYGNPFITMGYIYPAGTLDGGKSGVKPDGSPAFPDKVIGEWICRGWFVGDGGKTQTGPMVITTQIFNFGSSYGNATLVTDGYELADVGVSITRAVTGGTGPYRTARGEAKQVLLGLNDTQGVQLRLEVHLRS